MKKSKSKINLKNLIEETNKLSGAEININPNDLIEDANKIFDFIDKFEKLDYENVDLDNLQKEVQDMEKELRTKYTDQLEKEETKEDLDTEE